MTPEDSVDIFYQAAWEEYSNLPEERQKLVKDIMDKANETMAKDGNRYRLACVYEDIKIVSDACWEVMFQVWESMKDGTYGR